MEEKGGRKKGPQAEVLFSSDIGRLIEFSNGFADGTFLQDLFVVRHADQERGGTQAVNLSWDALGEIVNAGEGIV